MSKEEENKAVVRRIEEEIIEKGDWSVLPDHITPNFVLHEINQDYRGQEGLKQLITHLRSVFPDYYQTIEYMVAEGDMVAIFYTIGGTFKGELLGIAPTGKGITFKEAVLARFENGKQAEVWVYYDALTFYKKLGISPPSG